MTAKRVTIYVGEPLQRALDATIRGDDGSRSGRINTVAERYMEIVARSTPAMTESDWSAVVDANTSTVLDTNGVRCLHFNVEDGPELGPKWGVDVAALAAKIEAMPFVEKACIAEVIERFWSCASNVPRVEALVAAGARIA
jgi:hypothetical protein